MRAGSQSSPRPNVSVHVGREAVNGSVRGSTLVSVPRGQPTDENPVNDLLIALGELLESRGSVSPSSHDVVRDNRLGQVVLLAYDLSNLLVRVDEAPESDPDFIRGVPVLVIHQVIVTTLLGSKRLAGSPADLPDEVLVPEMRGQSLSLLQEMNHNLLLHIVGFNHRPLFSNLPRHLVGNLDDRFPVDLFRHFTPRMSILARRLFPRTQLPQSSHRYCWNTET